jgi:hypothetical protein
MRRNSVLALGFVVATIAGAFACSESTAPEPLPVDALLGELTVPAAAAASAATVGGVSAPASVTMPASSSCSYNSSTTLFECPAKTTNGVTVNVSYQLLDASNVAQSAYNASTTAALRTVVNVIGTISQSVNGTTVNGSFTHTGDDTLSGLLTDTHTLHGVGVGTVNFSGLALTLTTNDTIANVVLPKKSSGNPYPQSGSIITNVISPVPGTTARVVMTFNGTSIVTVTYVSTLVSKTCTVDLSKPSSAPVCQ